MFNKLLYQTTPDRYTTAYVYSRAEGKIIPFSRFHSLRCVVSCVVDLHHLSELTSRHVCVNRIEVMPTRSNAGRSTWDPSRPLTSCVHADKSGCCLCLNPLTSCVHDADQWGCCLCLNDQWGCCLCLNPLISCVRLFPVFESSAILCEAVSCVWILWHPVCIQTSEAVACVWIRGESRFPLLGGLSP